MSTFRKLASDIRRNKLAANPDYDAQLERDSLNDPNWGDGLDDYATGDTPAGIMRQTEIQYQGYVAHPDELFEKVTNYILEKLERALDSGSIDRGVVEEIAGLWSSDNGSYNEYLQLLSRVISKKT